MDLGSNVPGKEKMAPDFDSNYVERVYDLYKAAIGTGDHTAARVLMSDLKCLIPPLSSFLEQPPVEKPSHEQVRQITLMRGIQENAVVLSRRYPVAFEREFALLKPYYEDPWDSRLPPSYKKHGILRGYLVGLLEKGKIDDFHRELKSLSATSLADIKCVIDMGKIVTGEIDEPLEKRPHRTRNGKTCDYPSHSGTQAGKWIVYRGALVLVYPKEAQIPKEAQFSKNDPRNAHRPLM